MRMSSGKAFALRTICRLSLSVALSCWVACSYRKRRLTHRTEDKPIRFPLRLMICIFQGMYTIADIIGLLDLRYVSATEEDSFVFIAYFFEP